MTTAKDTLEKHFNYALQDIAEPNAVSMISEEHIDKAAQALYQQIMEIVDGCMPFNNMKGTEMVLRAEVVQKLKEYFS